MSIFLWTVVYIAFAIVAIIAIASIISVIYCCWKNCAEDKINSQEEED